MIQIDKLTVTVTVEGDADVGADLAVWDRKCIFVPEHYRKMGIADYGGAIGQASFDAFYQGATTPAKPGH